MGKRIIVSGGNELRAFSLPQPDLVQRVNMEGAGALAGGGGALFCACSPGGEIWRISPETLTPQALFAGGPGICSLALSPDGRRLYALCSEGDSVLMLDACGGRPLMLARAGLAPQGMALDGDTLAVAGGESGEVLLLDARSLCVLRRLPMPGPVAAAALGDGCVHALCLNETLSSSLVSCDRGGRRCMQLPGMPGAMLAAHGKLFSATHGRLFVRSGDGRSALFSREAPGRAGRLWRAGNGLFLCDAFSECLFALERMNGGWRLLCDRACDMAEV